MTPNPPNILYLHSHDTGRHLGTYGYPVATPHLDRLADQGTLFRNAFCVSPTCSPSRAGLLTGQWPHQCGQFGLSNRGYPLVHPQRHWLHTFRAAGYHTAMLGFQHVAEDELDLGFDEVRPGVIGSARGERNPELDAHVVADAVEAWLDRRAADPQPRPWLLDAGVIQTHSAAWPLLEPDEVHPRAEDRCRPPLTVPDIPESRAWYARHEAMARRVDAAAGRILRKLDDVGLADHTLVVFTTDHGLALPAGKCNLTDAGLEVALILRGPRDCLALRGGRSVTPMVSHLDVFPTLCEVAGVEPPAWLEGRSLLPLAAGRAQTLHEALFAEINVHGIPQPDRSVRTEHHKLIRRWSTPDDVLNNTDDRPVRGAQRDAGWPHRFPTGRPLAPPATDVLFDLRLDPTERFDRSEDPAYQHVYRDLADRLEHWMRRTDDPLHYGPHALPKPYETTPTPD